MLRRDGETFFFGTAMIDSWKAAQGKGVLRQYQRHRQQYWPVASARGRPRGRHCDQRPREAHGFCRSARRDSTANGVASDCGSSISTIAPGPRGKLGKASENSWATASPISIKLLISGSKATSS